MPISDGKKNIASDEEKYLYDALRYFIKEEEVEINLLMSPGGNRAFIPACKDRIKIFKSIMQKCKASSSIDMFSSEERHYFFRAIDYFRRAELREIQNCNIPVCNVDYIDVCKKRLAIYQHLLNYYHLSEKDLLK